MSIASPYSIYPGQAIRLTSTIKNMTSGGALTDPTTLVFTVQAPEQDLGVDYTYPASSAIGRSSLGVYTLDFVPDVAGVWRYQVRTSGNVASVMQGTFTVLPSMVIPGGVPGPSILEDMSVLSDATTRAVTNGADVALVIGTPLYVSGAGLVQAARANALPATRVVGLVYVPSIAVGQSGMMITDGVMEATTAEWDFITGGSGGLTFGTAYFLSPTTAGKMVSAAPSTTGQYLVRIGTALSATVLEVSITPEILL